VGRGAPLRLEGSRRLARGALTYNRRKPDRGRDATQPGQIPARGWRDIALRVWRDLERDNISLIAAGLAMYGLLAVFPALAAVISLYGLLFTPDDVIRHMKGFSAILPPGVWDIFNAQLQDVARRQSGTLTLAAVLAAVVALGSARSGMASLMRAANIAYQERESRSLLRRLHVSLAFTLGALVGLILLVALGVAAPLVLHVFSESPWIHGVLAVIRWTLLWIFAVLGCAATYRFAPARAPARWHWVSVGSVVAATLWIAGSALFAFYVGTVGSYTVVYGALGGVVVLLLWFYLSSFFLILGAEINAETERQTRCDTTAGTESPLGTRGAFAADTVGPTSEEMADGDVNRGNRSLKPRRRRPAE
jgi:membrane protein